MIIANLHIKITESFDVEKLPDIITQDIVHAIVDNGVTGDTIYIDDELIGSWIIKD
jgi:hypothetical protein